MDHEFRFLEFEGIQIAAFIESRTQNEHPGYFPQNILFYVEQGQLNIRLKHKLYTIPRGNFCLVRKYTELNYFKTWDNDENYAIVKALALHDEFINDVIKELGIRIPNKEIKEPIVNLQNNPILMGLYHSLTLYLDENQKPDKHLMYLKTKEAILGILQSSHDHLSYFYEFSRPVKADLREFMSNYMISSLSLETLAKLSGRSLSTFNRDFRKVFQLSPHKWLLKNRVNKAKEILQTSDKTPIEIYLDLGFKDLAHFSRTFKKEVGISPSEIVKRRD